MRNMLIGPRLFLGFGMVCLLAFSVSIFVLFETRGVAAISHQIAQRNEPRLTAAMELLQKIEEQMICVRNVIIAVDADSLAAADAGLRESIESGNLALESLLTLADAKDAASTSRIKEKFGVVVSLSKQVTALAVQRQKEAASALLHDEHSPATAALTAQVDAYVHSMRERSHQALSRLENSADRTVRIVLISALLVPMVGGFIAYLITNSIVQPLKETIAHVKTLATGDLTPVLAADQNDCITFLRREINTLQSALRDTVGALSGATHQLMKVATNMKSVTEQVRNGSERQSEMATSMAASLEQLSTSIAHVSNLGQDARGNSEHARERARSSSENIVTLLNEIEQVTRSIEQCAGRSEKLGAEMSAISSIVQVIRDVAEQTNLLALNAAIEAARAGDQGRGFAVVADEVRKLAEQTAHSALQISDTVASIQVGTSEVSRLMSHTVARVQQGLGVARDTGGQVEQVTENVLRVAQAIDGVADSLTEQNSASQQVSQSVETVVALIAENARAAATVDEAADQLGGLSSELSSIVKKFRIAA